MNDLFKAFAEEIEQRKLIKAKKSSKELTLEEEIANYLENQKITPQTPISDDTNTAIGSMQVPDTWTTKNPNKKSSKLKQLQSKIDPRYRATQQLLDNENKHQSLDDKDTNESSDVSNIQTRTSPIKIQKSNNILKEFANELERRELEKSNYGPKGMGLYDANKNQQRKKNNTGESYDDIGQNKNIKTYTSAAQGTAQTQAAKEAKADKIKSKKNPIKTMKDFSQEEIKAMEEAANKQ